MGTGVYTGMYIAQNFDVPKVDDPEKMLEKIKKLVTDAKAAVDDGTKDK